METKNRCVSAEMSHIPISRHTHTHTYKDDSFCPSVFLRFSSLVMAPLVTEARLTQWKLLSAEKILAYHRR